MFRTKIRLVLGAVIAAALVTLLGQRLALALDVVATVPSLAAIAKEVAAGRGTIKSLSLPTQDPHFVDAKPSLALDLNKAELVLAVGSELEVGWLPTLLAGARNPAIIPGSKGFLDCSRFVRMMDVHAHADRSDGDIHPAGNPHYLYDPRAAAAVARGIAARMSELDPGGKATYEAGLEAFLDNLGKARAGWEKRLAPSKGQPIIGYHKTWTYLGDWLGINQVEFLEPKPGVPPNPSHVAKVLVTARRLGVKVILQERFYPDSTGRLVAEKSGARLVTIPGGADFARGQSYVEHIEQIVGLLEKGFGG